MYELPWEVLCGWSEGLQTLYWKYDFKDLSIAEVLLRCPVVDLLIHVK